MKFNTRVNMTMTEIIRTLIRESVCELRFEDVNTNVSPGTTFNNRPEAEQFAKEHLMQDIPELQNYSMTEYFPINQLKEKWMFEAEPHNRQWRVSDQNKQLPDSALLNVVTIKHIIKDGISHWKFVFAQAEQSTERMTQNLVYETGLLPDYKTMVDKVNEDWQLWG